ncbi:hypothetical protein L1987_18554 [Smallanthus sonchifolius]|uniref:Uncharacterized protein n=1 Tax=Smallanthus sonchifolius TaxID=185202 RepID=A0ACB9IZW8_9ASTR|nr:hypothetical protein L1987_18554 [Smallanthus sonchifolius]
MLKPYGPFVWSNITLLSYTSIHLLLYVRRRGTTAPIILLNNVQSAQISQSASVTFQLYIKLKYPYNRRYKLITSHVFLPHSILLAIAGSQASIVDSVHSQSSFGPLRSLCIVNFHANYCPLSHLLRLGTH